MSAARRGRNPLRWLERKLFTFYGPADVRDPESQRGDPAPAPTGPEMVVGETVRRDPGALGAASSEPGGRGGAGEVVVGELAPPAVGPAPSESAPSETAPGTTDPGTTDPGAAAPGATDPGPPRS